MSDRISRPIEHYRLPVRETLTSGLKNPEPTTPAPPKEDPEPSRVYGVFEMRSAEIQAPVASTGFRRSRNFPRALGKKP